MLRNKPVCYGFPADENLVATVAKTKSASLTRDWPTANN
jgi:hypothetical protein